MIDVRPGSLVSLVLVVLVAAVAIGGCRSGRMRAPRHVALARSSPFAPCCEREVVHDLFDTAHREGTR
jgi:hypothetical protein